MIKDSISEDNYMRLIKIYRKAIKLNDDELIEDIEYLLLNINKCSITYGTTRSGITFQQSKEFMDESVKDFNQNLIINKDI